MTIKSEIKRKRIELVDSEEKLIKDLLSQCFVYLTEEQRKVASSINYKLMSK